MVVWVVFDYFLTRAVQGCGRPAECQELGEESGSRNCNKGPLVGVLEQQWTIPVSEPWEGGKKFPWPRTETEAEAGKHVKVTIRKGLSESGWRASGRCASCQPA